MSRIGNKSIAVPSGVEVIINGNLVQVKGTKGQLSQVFEEDFVKVVLEEGILKVTRNNDSKVARARHGLYRSLLQNIVEGVQGGFSKTMEIKGVGYRAALKGRVLEMQLGFSHPICFSLPEGIDVVFDEKKQTIFTISGIDKQLVGQVAADIRSYRKPEPYKGKGIRYIDEQVARKAGKSAKK